MTRNKLTSAERLGASLVGAIAIIAVLFGLIGDRCSSYTGVNSDNKSHTIMIEKSSDSESEKSVGIDTLQTDAKHSKTNKKRKGKKQSRRKTQQPSRQRDYLNEPINQN